MDWARGFRAMGYAAGAMAVLAAVIGTIIGAFFVGPYALFGLIAVMFFAGAFFIGALRLD